MKRQRLVIAVPTAALLLALTLPQGQTTNAAFTDASALTSGSVSAASLSSPAPLPSVANCVANNGVFSGSMVLRWGGVSPTSGSPPSSAYEYQVQFVDRDNNRQLLNTIALAHVGTAGGQQSYTMSSDTLANLLGLNWFKLNRVTTQIQSHLVGSSWYGLVPVSINWTTSTFLGVTSFNCNS